ncbi:MAG: Fic family protein [Burkholderiales bacterium]
MNASFDPQSPYDLPPLPPHSVILETLPVLKACVEARAALAALNEAVARLPNPDVLLSSLVLLEAKASSEVENIVTTTDRLFQFDGQHEDKADSATKETLRYRLALFEGLNMLKTRPLTTTLAEAVCTHTKGVEMTVRKVSGTALVNDRTQQTIYTPPEGEANLREKLANWERFCHAQPGDAQHAGNLDPLVRMAALHYQFEAIHPFTDGNGRTGRILNLLFLVEQGLLAHPVLFLSRYILANRSAYYAALLAVTREQAWEHWLLYMLEGVRETSRWTYQKIKALEQQMGLATDYLRSKSPRLYSYELVQVVFQRPYCRISDVAGALQVQRQAASRYLKEMCALKILREVEFGREKLFVHPHLMALLASEVHEPSPYGE